MVLTKPQNLKSVMMKPKYNPVWYGAFDDSSRKSRDHDS